MTLTDELGDVPPLSFLDGTPVVEDMLQEARAGLTEAVVTGPGRVILFYGRRSMGEGLKADEARDAAFLLTGAGTWVGKLAYLTADPMTIQEGKRAIAQAVSDNRVKARGPGHPQGKSNWPNSLSSLIPKGLPHLRQMCPETMVLMTNEHPDSLPEAKGHNRRWRDQQPRSLQVPSPSPDCGFKSDRSSLSMVSSVSS